MVAVNRFDRRLVLSPDSGVNFVAIQFTVLTNELQADWSAEMHDFCLEVG
jgi:hypothetical protein